MTSPQPSREPSREPSQEPSQEQGQDTGPERGRDQQEFGRDATRADDDFAARALELLTPSCEHRIRNSFMLFSSHAQLLAMGEPLSSRAARGHAALQAEVQRAQRVLDLIAAISGSADTDFACLGTMGNALAEFFVWENKGRSLPLEADVHAQIRTRVSPRLWLITSTLCLDALARAHADLGARSLRWIARADSDAEQGDGHGAAPQLELASAESGGLPFPRPLPALDARLVVYAARGGIVVEASGGRIRLREA